MKEKVIPQSINQCKEPDIVSKILWKWADLLRNIALVVAVIFAIVGLITGIALASSGLNAGGFFSGMLGGIIVALIEYITFFVVALFIDALANIVYNTHISANVALFTYKDQALVENNQGKKTKVTVGANEWQCPKCGNVHQNYVGSCGCGESKPL